MTCVPYGRILDELESRLDVDEGGIGGYSCGASLQSKSSSRLGDESGLASHMAVPGETWLRWGVVETWRDEEQVYRHLKTSATSSRDLLPIWSHILGEAKRDMGNRCRLL